MIHPHQSRFTRSHSTTGIIFDITESISENFDRDGLIYCYFWIIVWHSIGYSLLINNLVLAPVHVSSFNISERNKFVEHKVSHTISTSTHTSAFYPRFSIIIKMVTN